MTFLTLKREDNKYVKSTIHQAYNGDDVMDYEDIDYVDDLYEATLYKDTPEEHLRLTNMCNWCYKKCRPIRVTLEEVADND